MSSTVSAGLASPFRIKGLCYSISSACATGSHCIGAGTEQIQFNKQDIVFAGGSDEEHWIQTSMFDAMGALSTSYNATPEKASRPYDVNRDGFVVANGAGVVVLEELEHALERDAEIYAEVIGYGATADGYQIVAPSGEGAVRCMQMALETVDEPIDYINAHGTSTPIGDLVELDAIRKVFGNSIPPISSTKSLTGHTLGAAGVHEAFYSILMMKNSFISASVNIRNIDPRAADVEIVREMTQKDLKTVMSNSYGFGGTNACLVFRKY
jgi:3-oxoacyl-[acyl-carrier-protein] synthase-1